MNKNLRRLKSQGFTLTELIVVISIIGILATIITVSYVNQKKKARDAERISDLMQVSSALELYKADNHQYPAVSGNNLFQKFNNLVAKAGPLIQGKYLESTIPNTDGVNRKGYECSSDYSQYYLRFDPEYDNNATSGSYYYIKNGVKCTSNCTSL